MKQILFLIICVVYTIGSYAQNDAIVTFTSTTSISIKLYKSIDGVYQYDMVSEKFELDSDIPTTREFEINDFLAIRVDMKTSRVNLFLFPGDRITVNYINKDIIEIIGNNAVAHTYYDRQFGFNGMKTYRSRIEDSAMRSNDFGKMVIDLEKALLKDVNDSLALLQQNPEVSTQLISLLREEISICLYSEINRALANLFANRALSEQENAMARNEAENIFLKIDFQSPNILKLPFDKLILGNYYKSLWDKKSDEEKQNLLQGYDDNVFGPYVSYLLAPDYIRLPLLGRSLFIELKYNPDGSLFPYKIDLYKLYEYLKQHYPESEYVAILAKNFEITTSQSNVQQRDSIYFISQPINALSEFANLPELKDRYLLVDFWATWCFPCRQEFAYKDKVRDILESYDNLACVYISIDEDDRVDLWKNTVEKLGLYGYNIRAQKELIGDIKETVFQSQPITIPRYILISPNGELLNINLPRPSAGKELAEVVQKYLK
ncbi:MAG: TlpA family protein disulfide reductase [Bacteroidales bacterium]|jgi:thiol-disulfide isomerase/thioredoxin|nr:TlpA family protein disulfide reductase [Bacteroidales bacterium]